MYLVLFAFERMGAGSLPSTFVFRAVTLVVVLLFLIIDAREQCNRRAIREIAETKGSEHGTNPHPSAK